MWGAQTQAEELDYRAMEGWGAREAALLADALRTGAFRRLRVLYMTGNPIGDGGVAALAGALPHAPSLEEVGLEWTGCGAAGAGALAAAVRRLPKLQWLSLYNASVGAGDQALREACSAGGVTLSMASYD